MDAVHRQYEALPYPSRDPADEATRLIEGSPSHPVEIDHFVFGGTRDWTGPFRVLVAGGGTGDGLIMLAQKLADIACPAEITYLDISSASRNIAAARANARGLTNIDFRSGDLESAPDHGVFDYIDCCGVIHHLREPDTGLGRLAEALAPDGGLGLMVYAPYGRSGVEPLQGAFAALLGNEPDADTIGLARDVLDHIPDAHTFARNLVLGDHEHGDAGFHDLLLQARERTYSVGELHAALQHAGLAIAGFVESGRYDPMRYLPANRVLEQRVRSLDDVKRAALAEQLAGVMKSHVVYATKADTAGVTADGTDPDAIPHLRSVGPAVLAASISAGDVTASQDGIQYRLDLPPSSAPLVGAVGECRSLCEIAEHLGMDWPTFQAQWLPVSRELSSFNLLHYSRGARP